MKKRPSFFVHLHPPTIPAPEARFRYTLGLGGLSVFFLVIVTLTGALETLYYKPTIDGANQSLQAIDLLVPYGQLVRSLHYWSGQALLVAAVLHLIRVVLTGAYKPPRRFNMLLGLGPLVLILLLNFTGYALRWDDDIAWAILVGTNLLQTIPVVGTALYNAAVGGEGIGAPTVARFYGWHIYGLFLVAAILVIWHIFRVRRDGGISRVDQPAIRGSTVTRMELFRRETIAALVASILLLALAVVFPPALGAQANFNRLPEKPVAPWFFVWVQQLLTAGPPLLMGVLLPASLLVIVALIPYWIDRSQNGTGHWFHRSGRAAQVIILSMVLLWIALTLRGILG